MPRSCPPPTSRRFAAGFSLTLAHLLGCSDDTAAAGAAGSTTSDTTSTGAGAAFGGGESGGGGAGGTGGEGGAGNVGGAGGTGGMVCAPGVTQPCYTGPPATENVGLCEGGTSTCLPDGSAFGPCDGETVPSPEVCAAIDDEDCDGEVNEEGADCTCVPGTEEPCYSGDPLTEGVGECLAGTHVCTETGMTYGACMGEVLPQQESCVTLGDDDCDGVANELDAGCVCDPFSVASCYSGPAGTQNVGICVGGTHVCDATGTSYGSCSGEVLPQSELCTTIEDDDCDGTAVSSCPGGDHLWSKRFGGTSSDALDNVATDSVGNVFVGGSAVSDVDMGGGNLPASGSWDVLMGKLDPDGNHVWSQRFGNSGSQELFGMTADVFGSVFATGHFYGTLDFGGTTLSGGGAGSEDMFIVKFDASGVHQWSNRYGVANYQGGVGVAADASGNVVAVGNYVGNVSFGGPALSGLPTSSRVFVAKYGGGAGAHLWSKGFGGLATHAYGVRVDSSGSAVIIGSFRGTIDFGGGPLTSSSTVETDIFVAKLDWLGNHVWSKVVGNTQAQSAYDLAVDGDDNVFVSGTFFGSIDLGGATLVSQGSSDAFVVKFDPSGTHLWSQAFPGPSGGGAYAIATDSAGNIFLSGRTQAGTDFGGGGLPGSTEDECFVAKLDPPGNHLWSKLFGDTGNQWGRYLASDPAGNAIVGGVFETSIDFGGGPLMSAGNNDTFIAKLAP